MVLKALAAPRAAFSVLLFPPPLQGGAAFRRFPLLLLGGAVFVA